MEKAHFDFAADACKQILTFSTGILVLTVTFAKDTFVKDKRCVPWSLRLSWVCYLLSIFSAVWTLLALTGEFTRPTAQSNIYASNVAIPAITLIASFLVGLVLTVVAGWRATMPASTSSSRRAKPETEPDKGFPDDSG